MWGPKEFILLLFVFKMDGTYEVYSTRTATIDECQAAYQEIVPQMLPKNNEQLPPNEKIKKFWGYCTSRWYEA